MIELEGVGIARRGFILDGVQLYLYHSVGDLWIVLKKGSNVSGLNFCFVLPKEKENKLFPITETPVPHGTRPGLNREAIVKNLGETEIIFGFPEYSIVHGTDENSFYLMKFNGQAPYKVEMLKKIPGDTSALIFDKEKFVGFASFPTIVPFAEGKLYSRIG